MAGTDKTPDQFCAFEPVLPVSVKLEHGAPHCILYFSHHSRRFVSVDKSQEDNIINCPGQIPLFRQHGGSPCPVRLPPNPGTHSSALKDPHGHTSETSR